MNQTSVKTFLLIILLGVILANSVNLFDWILDGDALELCESEKKDTEKEESKTEKDEILMKDLARRHAFLSPNFSPESKEIDLHSIQCREILTPPPDFS